MNRRSRSSRICPVLLAAAALLGLAGAAPGQTEPPSPLPASAAPDATQPAGVWPTPELIDGLVRRVAADVAAEYRLEPAQARAVEDSMVQRWSGFLEANRRDLEPLVTDYLEARFAIESPSADRVAEWAARAMPVFNRLRQNVEVGETEVRSLLDESQRSQFDRGAAERRMQLTVLEGQLKRWSVGQFNASEWWIPPAGRAPADGPAATPAARIRTASPTPSPANPGGLPPRIAEELTAWERYVREFCDRYTLDRAQRNAADSILRELSARAADHAQRHRPRIDALELRIATGAGEEDEGFNRELVELYGPIDRMFAELAERLEKLPTEGQKRRAETPSPSPEPAAPAP